MATKAGASCLILIISLLSFTVYARIQPTQPDLAALNVNSPPPLALIPTQKDENASVKPPASTQKQQQAVIGFLDEALNYAKANGKEKAIKLFNDQKGPFYRSEQGLYISAFVTNVRNSAVSLANGRDSKLVGTERYSAEDKLGHYFVRQIIKNCKRGGGWTSYYEKNPAHNMEVQKKWSYAMPVDDSWCINAGFYLDEESDDGNVGK